MPVDIALYLFFLQTYIIKSTNLFIVYFKKYQLPIPSLQQQKINATHRIRHSQGDELTCASE